MPLDWRTVGIAEMDGGSRFEMVGYGRHRGLTKFGSELLVVVGERTLG